MRASRGGAPKRTTHSIGTSVKRRVAAANVASMIRVMRAISRSVSATTWPYSFSRGGGSG